MRPPRAMPIKFIDIGERLVVGETKPPAIQFRAEAAQRAQVVGDAEGDARGTAQIGAFQRADRRDLGRDTVVNQLEVAEFAEAGRRPILPSIRAVARPSRCRRSRPGRSGRWKEPVLLRGCPQSIPLLSGRRNRTSTGSSSGIQRAPMVYTGVTPPGRERPDPG